MADGREDFEAIRQIHTVLVLHFVDGMKQNDIAAALNLSPSKVNRLIAQGRKLGMLRIAVESPFQRLVDIEKQLIEIAKLAGAIVTPTVAGSPDSTDGSFTGPQTFVDASLGFEPKALSGLTLSADCKNCFNKAYSVSFLTPTAIYINPPRTYSVRALYRF